MKTDIRRVNYQGEPDPRGDWWTWVEYCDRCGCVVKDHATQSMKEPFINEVDFCYCCLRYLIDNDVPYEVASEQYSK